jgi:hypothetical protein
MMIKIVQIDNLFKVIEHAGIRAWEFITVHHTGNGVINDKRHWGQLIDDIHRNERDWENGMGYHFLINPDGVIEVGDRWIKQLDGAHNRGRNDISLGIGFVGNFSDLNQLPTKEQLDSFHGIRYQFSNLPIRPHCVFHNTECPGKNIDLKKWFNLFELKGGVG